jgi:hypothetical protein
MTERTERRRSPVAPPQVDARSAPRRRVRRLEVGAVDDAAERRADAAAAQTVDRLLAGRDVLAHAGSTRISRATSPQGQVVGDQGGEVDEETHRRIVASRGAGRPLPGGVRRSYESAMGVGLSDVRVHAGAEADDLNDRLGAAAFTTGSDIFFRGRLPDVTTPSGGHLLAHELAHVRQQGPSAPVGRIRRKVGFEFEVGSWSMEQLASHKTSLSWKETSGRVPINKNDTWAVDINTPVNSWGKLKLMGDKAADASTHIEWVIDPPVDETDTGRAELAAIMDQLLAVTQAMTKQRAKATIERRNSNLPHDLTTSRRYRASWIGFGLPKTTLVQPFATMEAEPQMTAGIRLTELAKLMEKMDPAARQGEDATARTARNRGTEALMGKRIQDVPSVAGGPAAVRAAFGAVAHTGNNPPAVPSQRLQGVVTLMRTYLIHAQRNNQYVKGLAPFLAKTQFGKLFSMLPEAGYYHDNQDEWVELVMTAAGIPMGNVDDPLLTASFQFVQAQEMATLRQLTRRAWIQRLAHDQVDLCTTAGMATTAMASAANELYGFGALDDRTDEVGPTRTDQSAILEFRRMAGSLPHTKWKPWALEIFDYVRAVNARQAATFRGDTYWA